MSRLLLLHLHRRCCCCCRRLYSTTTIPSPFPSAAETASLFLARAASTPPQTRTQTLDENQLHLLSHTLSRPTPRSRSRSSSSSSASSVSRSGTTAAAAIPAAHHLVYFTPSQPEPALGRDGTDTTYSAAPPFTRRMWAGGELRWASGGGGGKQNLLRLGQAVTETTVVRSAAAKTARDGQDMVVVGVEKTFENDEGWAVVDKRNWIFRREITVPSRAAAAAARPAAVPFPAGRHVLDVLMTPVTLFRFSALTFNAHKIHYDREWCREVEGHRDLVVHGPLNLIHMVDFWRDALGGGDEELVPKRVLYRATSPLYAGEPYRIVMDEEREGISEVRIVDGYGNVCMMGSIERFQ